MYSHTKSIDLHNKATADNLTIIKSQLSKLFRRSQSAVRPWDQKFMIFLSKQLNV